MRALNQANRVRLARAELKRQIADGTRTVAEVLLAVPWEAESMTVSDLLMSQHRWGRQRCKRVLSAIPITETKTVGSMTDRQRRILAAMLDGDAVAGVMLDATMHGLTFNRPQAVEPRRAVLAAGAR